MGVGVVSQRFCRVCGTEHSDPETCPGQLRATGPERTGRRVHVETPFGHEEIGVLLSPAHDQWLARIVTFPNTLWTVPGGRGALKFVGDTPQAAEAQAIVFVERHVQAKRFLRRDGLAPVDVLAGPAATSGHAPRAAVLRKPRCLPVRFVLDRAITRGVTVNLSIDGMFVGVASPPEGGRSLLIHLDMDGHTLPLGGFVMWNRRRADAGRPAGMGIRLSNPPSLYQSFVAALP